MEWAEIVQFIAASVDRRLIDRTSLTGTFDVELTFSRELTATADDPSVDIFTAVSHQLGLKLEPGRERMRVVVIDAAA